MVVLQRGGAVCLWHNESTDVEEAGSMGGAWGLVQGSSFSHNQVGGQWGVQGCAAQRGGAADEWHMCVYVMVVMCGRLVLWRGRKRGHCRKAEQGGARWLRRGRRWWWWAAASRATASWA